MTNDMKTRISTLWVVVMFNMLYADVLTMQIPEFLQELIDGTTDVKITEEVMLLSAVLIEIPIAMIFLSRVLGDTANRRTNVAAAIATTVFIVGGAEFALHYYFFAVAQLVCLALIVRTVRQRPNPLGTATPVAAESSTPAS